MLQIYDNHLVLYSLTELNLGTQNLGESCQVLLGEFLWPFL